MNNQELILTTEMKQFLSIKHETFLCFEKDKFENPIFISLYETNSDFKIKLYNLNRRVREFSVLTIIHGYKYKSISLGGIFLKINDITSDSVSKGYGSIAMTYLIKLAKERGYKQIMGEISFSDFFDKEDLKHGLRMETFYNKFGYLFIRPRDNGDKGSITLNL